MNRVLTDSVEAAATAGDLYISEIIEGSSLNKAVELFNPTGAPIDLSDYELRVFFNGSDSAGTTVALSGVLQPGETFVIADDGADQAILDVADLLTTSSLFNGDDAIVLFHGDAVVDAFGQIGTDPGSEWPGGGQNDTLRRKEAIQSGDTDATDAFDAADEWDAFPQNDFSDLGQRTGPVAQPTVINEVLGSTTGADSEYIELFGAPGASLAGLSLIIVESDAGDSNGAIDRRIDFADGDRLGDNGFFLLANAQAAQTYGVTPNADFAADFIENSSYTLALVETASLSGDAVGGAEVVVDAVAITDGGEGDSFFFDAPVIGPDGPFLPAGAGRDVDGTGTFQILSFGNESPPNTPTAGTGLNGGGGGDGEGSIDDAPTLISAVQGDGEASPLAGQTVVIEAVVTGDFQNGDADAFRSIGGFFVMEEAADRDGDAATSEGLFIDDSALELLDVAEGDVVRVLGVVTESFGRTQITASEIRIETPAAVTDLDAFAVSTSLPALADREAVENMLLAIEDPLTFTESFDTEQFGEITVATGGEVVNFTQDNAPSVEGFAAHLAEKADRTIQIDDGTNGRRDDLDPIVQPDGDLFAVDQGVRMGQTLTPVTAVMDFNFGAHKLRLPGFETFDTVEESNPRPAEPADVGGSFTVAAYNVLNYFTTFGSRGADNQAEFDRQTEKLVTGFLAIDADVIALVEIENNGTAIATLTAELNARFDDREYAFVDTGLVGEDAIAVGFVYDTLTTELVGDFAVLDDPSFVAPLTPGDDQNRAALAQTFREIETGGVFTATANHFKSKGSLTGNAADEDQNDGAGRNNATREAASVALLEWLATDPTNSGDDDFIILGDLNAYAMETPITTLEAAGYVNTVKAFEGVEQNSYRFSGEIGTLDYAMASETLNGQVTGATAFQINADEMFIFDYNLDSTFNNDTLRPQDQGLFDGQNPAKSSDHDPIIVGLNLTAEETPPMDLQVTRAARSAALGEFDESAAESIAHENGRFFVTNSDAGRVDVLEQDGDALVKVGELPVDGGGEGGPNSVAVKNGVVAVAVAVANEIGDDEVAEPGVVALFDAVTLAPLATISLATGVPGEGVLPDMLTFSEDGTKIFVAIEGEPDDVTDPKGGLSVITLDSDDIAASTAQFFGFEAFDDQVDALRDAGVRIFPGKLPSEDFEPEYIAIDPQTGNLHITLQEANALAVFDTTEMLFTDIQPLGLKDHGAPDNGIDPSDRDDAIAIAPQPGVVGMYMPDAIASFVAADGQTYFVTANEGDARDEDARVRDLTLDPTAFPDAETLQQNENLGRLEVSTNDGDTDGDGDFDQLFAYGSRSFSIYDADGNQVFDSGDDFEQIIAAQTPALFNVTNDDPFDFDARSDAKGPEPEAIAVAEVNGRQIAVIGLERANGLMFYDVTDVTDVQFLKYLSTVDPADEAAGEPFPASDLGPEVIAVIDAADSANGKTQIAVSNEVSGTVSLYTLEDILPVSDTFTLEILHMADQEPLQAGASFADIINASGVMNALEAQDLGDDGLPDNTIRLSSGDVIIPGLFYDASQAVFGSAGIADIQIQNELGFQAIALGNHEFDNGPAELAGLISGDAPGAILGADFAGAAFPYLGANLDFSGEASLAALEVEGGQAPQAGTVTASVVIEENGEPIGIVGAITPTLASISSPGGVGVSPSPFDANPTAEQLDALAAEIQTEVDALLAANEGLNKIVLLTHMQRLDIERELAARLEHVDVIIGGGSNTRLFDENDRPRDGDSVQGVYPEFITNAGGTQTALVNTDGSYKYVGRLVLDFDADGNIIAESYDAEVSGAYATDAQGVADLDAEAFIDAEVREIVEAIETQVLATEGNVFGVSDVFLNGNRSGVADDPADTDGVRTQETNLGNLTADANIDAAHDLGETDVVISLKNGGGIRASIGQTVVPPGGTEPIRLPNGELVVEGEVIKPAGGVSENDIKTVLAFNNGLVAMTLTGEEIVALLEHGVSAIPGVSGRFPQIAGVEFSYDPDLPVGARIQSAAVKTEDGEVIAELVREGVLLNNEAEFRIVTLDFLSSPRFDDEGNFTGAGDGYPFPNTNTDPEAGEVGDPAVIARVNRVELEQDGVTEDGGATFANVGSEQDALAEYLLETFGDAENAFDMADTGRDEDSRIQNLNFREDDVLDDLIVLGTEGRDQLVGTQFSETFLGLGGNGDSFTGAGGADTFQFGDELTNGARERFIINDYSSAEGDAITLAVAEFDVRFSGRQAVISAGDDRIYVRGDFDGVDDLTILTPEDSLLA